MEKKSKKIIKMRYSSQKLLLYGHAILPVPRRKTLSPVGYAVLEVRRSGSITAAETLWWGCYS